VTANAIASLDQVADGRTVLGIGAGDSAVYSIGRRPASVDELAESAESSDNCSAAAAVTFGGEPFRLESCRRDVQVYVAAEGPQTLRMAGEVADGVIFGGGPKPETVEELGLANVRRGAERAGRSLEDIDIVALTPTCVAETRAEAVEKLKPVIEPIAYHNFTFSVEEAPDEVQADLRSLVDAHDMQEHGNEEADALSDINDEVWEYLGDASRSRARPRGVSGTPAGPRKTGRRSRHVSVPPDRIAETERFHEAVLGDSEFCP